jgi:endonuclease/exonuclease/phosphatase family metal-dependent hydrolase
VTTLRLVSFNLFSGRSLNDGLVDVDRAAQAVASTQADVLALQEVDHRQPRSGTVDQAAMAAHALTTHPGEVDHRFVGLLHGTPGVPGWRPVEPEFLTSPYVDGGSTAHLDGQPSYGIALASRVPVESWHVLRLNPARGRWPIPLPTRPPSLLWLNDEPRAVLAAVLRSPRMTVACTHLSFVPGVNVRQLRAVRRWLDELPGPRVLLGDLNLPGRLPARITGWTPAVTAATFPSPAPRTQLDHVLVSGLPAGATVRGSSLHLPISDHRALAADLVLPGGH